MGNDLKEDLNSIKYQKFETNIKRKNEIDKIKIKTLKIDSTFINNALIYQTMILELNMVLVH